MSLYLILLTLLLCTHSLADLVPVEVSSKLPTVRFGTSAIYDGNDAIYVIGGFDTPAWMYLRDIVKYTISTGEVQLLATLPVGKRYVSTSMDDTTGDIYIHHGQTGSMVDPNGIYKYTPSTNTVHSSGSKFDYLELSLRRHSVVHKPRRNLRPWRNQLPHEHRHLQHGGSHRPQCWRPCPALSLFWRRCGWHWFRDIGRKRFQ